MAFKTVETRDAVIYHETMNAAGGRYYKTLEKKPDAIVIETYEEIYPSSIQEILSGRSKEAYKFRYDDEAIRRAAERAKKYGAEIWLTDRLYKGFPDFIDFLRMGTTAFGPALTFAIGGSSVESVIKRHPISRREAFARLGAFLAGLGMTVHGHVPNAIVNANPGEMHGASEQIRKVASFVERHPPSRWQTFRNALTCYKISNYIVPFLQRQGLARPSISLLAGWGNLSAPEQLQNPAISRKIIRRFSGDVFKVSAPELVKRLYRIRWNSDKGEWNIEKHNIDLPIKERRRRG